MLAGSLVCAQLKPWMFLCLEIKIPFGWCVCLYMDWIKAILGGLMECIPPMLASLLFVLIQTWSFTLLEVQKLLLFNWYMVCKWWQSHKQVASEHCEFHHNWHMVREELAVDWVNDEQTLSSSVLQRFA
jgi:hypothetical protein